MDDDDVLKAATAESGLELLALRRRENDQKLKSRFERIFEKYEYDFDGVGDEIDIVTGEVLIDNGHLKNMLDEEDPDASEFPRHASDYLEEPLSDGELLDVGLNNLTASGLDVSGRSGRVDTAPDNVAHDQASRVLDAFARPAPRLARLLVNQDEPVPQNNLSPDSSSRTAMSNALPAEHRLEGQETVQLPGIDLMQSMLGSVPALAQSGLDKDTLQALGLSIAAGLMKLISTTSTGAVRKENNSAMEKAWSYPEPGHAPQAKRKMPDGSDDDISDRQRKRTSLWAPKNTRRPRKQAATVPAGLPKTPAQCQSTQMPTQQPHQEPDERASDDQFASNRETEGTPIKQATPVKRVGALEYELSLNPSQNTDELSLIESLRSECADLKLQSGSPYVRQEEALLLLLKKRMLLWRDIAEYFPYRNRQSIQNRYQRKFAPKAVAVHGTNGQRQILENALADRIPDHTPSRGLVATLSDGLNTSADEYRLREADAPLNVGPIACIPESPDHAAQDVEERLGQRFNDQRHRPSGCESLESSGNDLRVAKPTPLGSGPAREGVCRVLTLATVAKSNTLVQLSDPALSAIVADTEQSSSASSIEDANSPDLGLARPSIFDELLQAADAQWQSRSQATTGIVSEASSSPPEPHQFLNARVESSPPTGRLDVNAKASREGDFRPRVQLHELGWSRIDGSMARDQLQGDLSASIHPHQSAVKITSNISISKDETKAMTTRHASPDIRLARETPEKVAAPQSTTNPTPSYVSNSHKDKRQSLDSANRFASRTPKHGALSTTQSTQSSPSRAKTPVPRRSAIGHQGSVVKSASSQRRFVETSVREISDAEDELA